MPEVGAIRKVYEDVILPRALELAKPKRVLQVGMMNPKYCNSEKGDYTEWFPDAEVVSVDNDPEKKPSVLWDIESGPIVGTGQFDLVLYNGMFEYIFDNISVLGTLFSSQLVDGGWLLFGAPFAWEQYAKNWCGTIYWSGITPTGLDRLFEETGFVWPQTDTGLAKERVITPGCQYIYAFAQRSDKQ